MVLLDNPFGEIPYASTKLPAEIRLASSKMKQQYIESYCAFHKRYVACNNWWLWVTCMSFAFGCELIVRDYWYSFMIWGNEAFIELYQWDWINFEKYGWIVKSRRLDISHKIKRRDNEQRVCSMKHVSINMKDSNEFRQVVCITLPIHYSYMIMSAMAFQITGVPVVC